MSDKKNPVGRPSKYNKDIQKAADDYVDNWNLYLEIKSKENPESVTHVINSIPSIASLALELNVHRDSIYEWEKDDSKRQFSDTLERLRQKQEAFLIHHGLTKGYDSGFAKFMAINITKYRDKIETVNTNREIKIEITGEDINL